MTFKVLNNKYLLKIGTNLFIGFLYFYYIISYNTQQHCTILQHSQQSVMIIAS